MSDIAEAMIDGAQWECGLFSATEGLKILTKLTKAIGPALGAALGGAGSVTGLLDSDIGADALGKALAILKDSLDEDDTVALIKRILKQSGACCDGKPVDATFDIVFQGRYATLFKVLAFVLKTNYADFFDSLTSGSNTVAA